MDRKRDAVIKKIQTKKGVVGINFRQPKRLAQPYYRVVFMYVDDGMTILS